MSLTFAYGSSIAFGNPVSIAYLTSLPTTPITTDSAPNGSFRWVYTPGDEFPHIEKKMQGIWNDSGARFSSGSVELGRDLTVGAAASFIETFNEAIADEHQSALIPHVPFNNTGTQFLHSPILDDLRTDIIFSGAVSEIVGTQIGISFKTNHARFVNKIFHEVGSVGASSQVEYSVYSGTDDTGILISRNNLPSIDLLVNTTLTVTFPKDIGLNDATDFFIELKSDTSFSLKTDSSGNPLTSFSEQHLGILDVFTENLMLDEDLGIMFDENLGPLFAIQFP